MARKRQKSERVSKYGEVFTPEWLVKDMCDLVERESGDAFQVLTKTFLEPSCGNGNFLVEILRRKLLLCNSPNDGLVALSTIFGVELLPDNVEAARRRMKEMFVEKFGGSYDKKVDEILQRNIICGNFLTKQTAKGEKIWFLEEQNGEEAS